MEVGLLHDQRPLRLVTDKANLTIKAWGHFFQVHSPSQLIENVSANHISVSSPFSLSSKPWMLQ